jgi:hypothetical protein
MSLQQQQHGASGSCALIAPGSWWLLTVVWPADNALGSSLVRSLATRVCNATAASVSLVCRVCFFVGTWGWGAESYPCMFD